MDATAMAVLLVVLAIVLVGGFMTVWKRDKDRSEDVAEDPSRLDTDHPRHSDD